MPKTEAAMQRIAREIVGNSESMQLRAEETLTREFGEVLTKADELTSAILGHKPEVGCLECRRRAGELRAALEKVMRSGNAETKTT